MLNVYYLAKILIFSVVTARYLVVTGGYHLLLVVTARYRSLLLIPTFSMNGKKYRFQNKKDSSKQVVSMINTLGKDFI